MKVKIFITEEEDAHDDRAFLRLARNNLAHSLSQLSHEWRIPGVEVSRSTTYSRLKSSGFKARTPRKVPILTKAMKNMRLKFAKLHQHMMTTDWRKVNFISIVLFKSNNN